MKRYIPGVILLYLTFGCDTSSNIKPPDKSYFLKYFGSEGNQEAVGLIVNSDGTFFILGNSRTSTSSSNQIYLAQADARGNVIWQNTFGTTEMTARDFILTSDGKLAVVANLISTNDQNVFLGRFSPKDGTLLANDSVTLKIDTTIVRNEFANSITELSDAGFLIAGYAQFNPGSRTDAVQFRVDKSLKQRLLSDSWYQIAGAGSDNRVVKGFETPSDSIYMFGSTNASATATTTDQNFWVYVIDKTGRPRDNSDKVPEFVINNTDEILTNVIKTQFGYLMSGVSIDPNSQNASLKVTKIRFDDLIFDVGDIEFIYPGRSLGKGAVQFATAFSSLTSQGYFVAANSYNSAGNSDILLTKLDLSLKEIWSNPVTIGGDGDDTVASVAELPDGHIIVLGTMSLGNSAVQNKIALMKLNAQGKLSD